MPFGQMYPQGGQSQSGGGFGAQIGDINNLLQGITQKGYFNTQPLDLQRLTQFYNQFLGGAEQRQAGQMGQQGFAQGASMGLQNPALLANRYSNQAYQNFADQYGRAGMELPQMAFQSQLVAHSQNLENILKLLAMRQSGLGGQFQQEQSGFNFGRDLLPGLVNAGGKIGAAALMA